MREPRQDAGAPAAGARCGLGQCKICNCDGFVGGGNVCQYCHHHYADHVARPFRTPAGMGCRAVGGRGAAPAGVAR